MIIGRYLLGGGGQKKYKILEYLKQKFKLKMFSLGKIVLKFIQNYGW